MKNILILLMMTVLTVRCIRLGEDQKASASLLGRNTVPDEAEKSLADLLLVRNGAGSAESAGNETRIIALDIGGRLYEAMKAKGRDYMNYTEFKTIVLDWFKERGTPIPTDQEHRVKAVWDAMNTEKAESLSKSEIFHWLFKLQDGNHDGIWNFEEIVDFITDWGRMLHRDMKEGWKTTLKKHYDEVNYGVSARELELALSRNGQHIGTFKDFLLAHSNPKPQGAIDPLALGELFYQALAKEKADHLSKERWLDVVRRYFLLKHKAWNAAARAEATKTFDKVDKDKSGTCNKEELFKAIFDMFDRNGDNRLTDKELKQMFQWYAKFMGRELQQGWWEQHLEPAVREIEAGVTPDELRAYLQKKNQRITDFRHAVISVSKKVKVSEYERHRYKEAEERKRREAERKRKDEENKEEKKKEAEEDKKKEEEKKEPSEPEKKEDKYKDVPEDKSKESKESKDEKKKE